MAISHAFSNAIADGTNTQIVRPSDWNSAHNFTQNLAGNTAGVASVSGTDIVWAGGANITVSANGQTISIVGGAGAAADGGVFITAPGSSQSVGAIEFSNANGVSFGMAGSTVTATVATNYQSQGAYLTTAALSNHSHGNPILALTNLTGTTASNSAGLTLSLSAGDLAAFLTTAALSNHSHGNPTLALTNISGTTASNSAGLTLSLSAANPGGGAGVTRSYFNNVEPNFQFNVANLLDSTRCVFPLDIPGVSADWVRQMISMGTNSTTRATSADTSVSMRRASTLHFGLYTNMTGASSLSLQSVATFSVLSAVAFSLTANANGSEYSVSQSITYPSGSGATSEYTTSYATTQTNFALLTTHLTGFSGLKILDIPVSSMIDNSNYWGAIGLSTAVTTVQNAAWSNWVFSVAQVYARSQTNIAWGLPSGATINSLTNGGGGLISSAGMGPLASVALTGISSFAGNPTPHIELMRFA